MSAPTATLSPAPTDARRAPAGRQRIVVADDHPVFREGMVRALVETGRYEIAGEAPDGNAALDLIRRQRPDVALVDLRMPGPDGLDLVRRLSGEGLGVSLVLLSAFMQPKIVDKALAAGAAAYLSKDARARAPGGSAPPCVRQRGVARVGVAARAGPQRKRHEERARPGAWTARAPPGRQRVIYAAARKCREGGSGLGRAGGRDRADRSLYPAPRTVSMLSTPNGRSILSRRYRT
jgi:CheY-like chemotaxis protein